MKTFYNENLEAFAEQRGNDPFWYCIFNRLSSKVGEIHKNWLTPEYGWVNMIPKDRFKENQWLYATTGDEEILMTYNGISSFGNIMTKLYYWIKNGKILYKGSSDIGMLKESEVTIATTEQIVRILYIVLL